MALSRVLLRLVGRKLSCSILVGLLLFVVVLGSTAVDYALALGVETEGAVQLHRIVTESQNLSTENYGIVPVPTVDQSNISASGLDPAAIYNSSYRSVVTIEGSKTELVETFFGPEQATENVIGSGFVVERANSDYVVTNFHVVDGTVNTTVTFWDGDSFPARIVGTDGYSDLAVVSVGAPSSDLYPLKFASSSVAVGTPVVAIGNPFGLSGSITFGIVSQTGRTIEYQSRSGTFTIADAIQFSAPINPGNSGGPLLNMYGLVMGITSAAVSGSQGVGFAIPSGTMLRELPSLIENGRYDLHPYVGITGADMNYQLSQLMGTNVTYGVLVEKVDPGSPAEKAGLQAGQQTVTVGGTQYLVGGDVVVAVNGSRIVNYDALLTYLEKYTLPGQMIMVTIIRDNKYQAVQITIGSQPS